MASTKSIKKGNSITQSGKQANSENALQSVAKAVASAAAVAAARTAQTAKTTGAVKTAPASGYYSRPEIGTQSSALYNAADQAQRTLQQREDTVTKLRDTADTAYSELERWTNNTSLLLENYNRNPTAENKAYYRKAEAILQMNLDKFRGVKQPYQDAEKAYHEAFTQYETAVRNYNDYSKEQERLYTDWKGTIRGADAIRADLDALDGEIAAQKQREYQPVWQPGTLYQGGAAAVSESASLPYAAAAGNVQTRERSVSPQMQALLERQALLQEELDWSEYFRYADLMQNADFGEKSKYVSTENGKGYYDPFSGQYLDPGFGDIRYDYINRNERARSRQSTNEQASGVGNVGAGSEYLSEMSDDEIAIFNYVYATEGKNAAYSYLDYLTKDLTARQRQRTEEEFAQFAKDHWVGASALSILESPGKGISYLGQAADYLVDGEIDQNAGYNQFSYTGNAIRNQVAQKWGPVGSFLYQTGMSMGDFLLTGKAFKISQVLSLAIMGTGAAADAVIDAKDRGLSDDQAFALGTIAGAAEVITEKVSLEALLDKTAMGKSAVGYFIKNVVAEGSEEGASDLINLFADILISQDKSQWQQSIDHYKSLGMAEGEAFGNAFRDQAASIGLDVLGGALSGGVMAGGSLGIDGIQTYGMGRDLKKSGISADRLAELGKTYAADTVAYKLAGKVDDNTGAYTIGRLFNALGASLSEQNKADIAQSLERQGMDPETAKKHAEIMEYIVEGGTLSDTQRNMIEKNDVLASTMREVIIDPNSTVNQRISGYREAAKQLETGRQTENASRTERALPGQENSVDGENLPAEKTNAAESGYAVSEDGKTTRVSTGEEVRIQEIESVKDGRMTFRLADGSTADASDIQYASEEEALVYEAVAGMDVSAQAANILVEAFKTSREVSAREYALGIQEAFRYGLWNAPRQDLNNGPFSSILTEHQRNVAYENGRIVARQRAEQEHAAKVKQTPQKQAGKVHFDGDRNSLSQRQQTSLSALDTVADALGIQIYVFESDMGAEGHRIGKNGWYDPKDSSIHIDLFAGTSGEDTMLFTAAHELTHFIRDQSPAKFQAMADFLMDEYGKKGVSVRYLAEEQIRKAKKNGRTIDYDTAYEEVVADSMETMLSDGKVVEKLRQKDKSIWEMVKGYIRDLAEKIRKVYAGLKPDSLEGKLVAEMKDSIEKLQELFTEGLVDAGDNYQATIEVQSSELEGGKLQYSERGFSEQVDEVFSGTFDRTNALYMGKTPQILQDIGLNGNLPMLTTASHIRKSVMEKNTQRHQHGLTEAQIKSLPDKISKPAMVLDSLNKGSNSVVVVTDMLDVDGSPIVAIVMADGRGMYNNVEIDTNFVTSYYGRDGFAKYIENNVKADNFLYINKEKATALSTESSTQWLEQLEGYDFDTIIRKTRAKVKENGAAETRKFSLRDTVEETKNLIAVHNLSEEKLVKILQLGGLPMPSIAIIRAKDGHSKFGEISLVFSKDTIAPELSRSNKVYSADAWTPTYPNIDYKANEQVEERISSKYSDLMNRFGYEAAKPMYRYAYELEDILNRDGGEAGMMENLYGNTEMMQLYLLDSGHKGVQPIYRETRQKISQDEMDMNRYFINHLGMDTINSILVPGESGPEAGKKRREAIKKYDAEIREVYKGFYKEQYGLTDDEVTSEVSGYSANRFLKDIRDAYNFTKNNGISVRTEVDSTATKEAIRNAAKDGYKQWVDNLFRGAEEKSGIRNEKDLFTPSGKRRSFEALHYENNLENVIKSMREKGEKGIGTFGRGSIFGVSTTEFSSVDEIKQAESRLQKMSVEEYQKIKKGFSDRFFELASSLPKNKNSFTDADDAANMLIEAVAKCKTKSGMANYLKKESQGWANYSDYVVDDLVELVRDIRSMPTGYFEAKPQRAVGFDEVVAVIAPDNLSSETTKMLSDIGLNVVPYANGNEESRKEALNSLENVKFSDRDPSVVRMNQALEKENAKLKEDLTELKKLLKLQKSLTHGTMFTKSSVEFMAKVLMENAGAKGPKSELAVLLNEVYTYIAGSEELTWDGMAEKAQPAVDWLQDHAQTGQQVDTYGAEVLRQLRGSRIYLDEHQKKEAAYQFGSFNAYRKQLFGTVTITDKNAVSLDSKWAELAEMYPDVFDADITSTDMPGALLDAVDSLRNAGMVENWYDQSAAAQDLLAQVYDGYWRVSTLNTVADVKQKQIDRLKGEHLTRMEKVKATHAEQIAKLKREHRDELKQVRQEYRANAEAKQQQVVQKYREAKQDSFLASRDARIMEQEFLRLVRAYEKQSKQNSRDIADLEKALRKEARSHSSDGKTWEREFDRLMKEYEASDRNVDRLQEKVEAQRKSAKEKVESRKRTAMRSRVQSVVNELNDYLLNGTKDKHVPIELQKAVAEALDAVNMDTVGAEERIAKLEEKLLNAKTAQQAQEISRTIDRVRSMGDSMKGKLQALKDGYEEIIRSDDPMVANAYDPGIAAQMMTLMVEVGDTPLRDMNLRQLEAVHDVYTMVLTTIRNANKTFKAARNATVRELGQKVMDEVKTVGGKRQYSTAGMEAIRKFGWNNLKPVYAFEMIGSDTFREIFKNVRAGEDVWAVDVNEARGFYLERARKYGFSTWDSGKQYEFTSASGMNFRLNLEQIMSLYAYSKREQAADHLRKGGIVIDESTEVTMKTKLGIKVKFNPTEATAYNISSETLSEIIGTLTPEQKSFVDEMQTYLSSTMGEKGNEVSLQMYGVKLFKEKNYFPLKSASQYMAKAKEQQQGEVKIKNSGFSKETVKHASNPVVLAPFMQVWADHVNDMSMYHAFVLPMEDFYRVYNFKTPTSDLSATESVEMTLQNAYGKGATKYIDQLLKDLNGGARVDSTTGIINKSTSLFKKGAVFASASVVIQQPSAIARALSMIDMKYFAGPKVDKKGHKAAWGELKRYAPVAAIKEMGYFDTNMGKSTQDYILGKEYEGIGEKAKALFTDSGYRDEALSRGAALADEITWCSIWEAVKRETKAKYPGVDVKSEAFLKLAGERFTDVVVKTQVYDSVLSRSANMRSKDTGMKMATAFMAEPTTSINMVADALLKGKRDGVEGRRYCRRAIGSVVAAQILNSILVSFVYAARDDDEDETYLEKYAGSFVAEVIDGLNPATYIPFVKDIVSIVQGYDVERSDMAVVSDLWNAWKQLDSDSLSGWRKVENFAGSICQIFGLPLKNIMRDVRGMYQAIDTFTRGQETTLAGLKYAVMAPLPKMFGGGEVSNQQQLYEAYLNGDEAHIARVESRYKDQSSIDSAIRAALRENDPRIREAAEADIRGDPDERVRIAKEIIAEGHFHQDNVVVAINAEINSLKNEESTSTTKKAYGLYQIDDFALAISNGDKTLAKAAKSDIIQIAQKNGKTQEDAEKNFNSSASGVCKELFQDNLISESKAINALVSYCGMKHEDAEERVRAWDFEAQYGFAYEDRKQAYMDGQLSGAELRRILVKEGGYTEEDAAAQVEVYDWAKLGYDATISSVKKYNTYCKAAGVPKDTYLQIVDFSNNTENEVDEDGNTIYYSAVQKIMERINQLSIPDNQKTAIALSLWKESTVEKYKLW